MKSLLRLSAKFVSGILHPLFVPTYALVLLLLVNPYLFGVNSLWGRSMLIWQIFLMTFFMPLLVVFLMSRLKMVSSIHLPEREERIGPYIATGIFYLWIFVNLNNSDLVPRPYVAFMLGSVFALFLAFFFNNFTKISAHAIGMGGLIGFILLGLTAWHYEYFWIQGGSWGPWELRLSRVFVFVVLLAGIVGSARLLLKAHTHTQVAMGFLAGLAAQYIAWLFVG